LSNFSLNVTAPVRYKSRYIQRQLYAMLRNIDICDDVTVCGVSEDGKLKIETV